MVFRAKYFQIKSESMVENTQMKELYETLKAHEQNFLNTGERVSKMESGLNELHHTLTTVNQNIEYLWRKSKETGSDGGKGNRAESSGNGRARQDTYTPPLVRNQGNQNFHSTPFRMEFPEFNGENPQSWIGKANRFFQLHPKESSKKVLHAGYYMVDVADIWYTEHIEGKGRLDMDWECFCVKLLHHFTNLSGKKNETTDSHKHGGNNPQEVVHWHNRGVAARALHLSRGVEKPSGRVTYIVVLEGLCRFNVQELSTRETLQPLPEEKRGFTLRVRKKHKQLVLNSYLDYVMEKANELRRKKQDRLLYTNSRGGSLDSRGHPWESVPFKHPSTFDTLAMDPVKKSEIKADLLDFANGESFYQKTGRAWKRGYLLYGPPGTGKSSMIAAMANFLGYDIYDLELTEVNTNSELRKLLMKTSSKSIIVIEDIDCSINLTNRNKNGGRKNGCYDIGGTGTGLGDDNNTITLSGLLNFTDGLWSCCGSERIFVFTTNHIEKLDSALLRRGRMDMHVHMSYCSFPSLKILLKNYLGYEECDLEKHVLDQVEQDPEFIALSKQFKATAMELISALERKLKIGGRTKVLLETVPVHKLADIIVASFEISFEEQLSMLDSVDVKVRLSKATELVDRHLQSIRVAEKITQKVEGQLSKSQKEFLLRQQMRAIKEELGDNDDDGEDVAVLERKMQDVGMPANIWKNAQRELRRLEKMQHQQPGYNSSRVYLELLAEFPWQKASEDWELDFKAAKERLDSDHYGLVKVKQLIIEYLAVRQLKPDARGPVLCFVGPPGVGKTSLASSIAAALGQKFVRISIGGVKDEADIRGHRRTYIGSMAGRLIDGMKRVGVCNPVLLLDEIDKTGSDVRGDPVSALLEVLDPEQNKNSLFLNLTGTKTLNKTKTSFEERLEKALSEGIFESPRNHKSGTPLAKFLKACETIHETPVKIRKGLEKWEVWDLELVTSCFRVWDPGGEISCANI